MKFSDTLICQHKGQYETNNYNKQLIHSYYDDIFFDEIWLKANVKIGENKSPYIVYEVNAPSSWDQDDIDRIEKHFERFHLNELYPAQANCELFSNKNVFKEYINSTEGLKFNLERQARSLTLSIPNTWRASLFRELSTSFWFCTIGVYNIKYESNDSTPSNIVLDD